jgi:hypothetical protein
MTTAKHHRFVCVTALRGPDRHVVVPCIRYLAIAATATLIGSGAARAASAKEVLPACKLYLSVIDRRGAAKESEIAHLMDAGECLGAVYAMLNMSEVLPGQLKACPPSDTQPDEGVRAVVAYIEQRPERGREDFMRLGLEALRASWPCK